MPSRRDQAPSPEDCLYLLGGDARHSARQRAAHLEPVFDYNGLMLAQYRWEVQQPLAAGKHMIVFDFTSDGPGIAKGGTGMLNGQEVATQKVSKTIPFVLPGEGELDVSNRFQTDASPIG